MTKSNTKMDRRDFIKQAGIGSLALAMLPAFDPQSAMPSAAPGQTHFRFISLSGAGEVDGVFHVIVMSGQGIVTPANAVGGGSFVHFDNNPALPPPKPILGSGSWKAKKFMSFEAIGSWGVNIAGTLVTGVELKPDGGPRIPATLTVNCNVPPGGLFTGLAEGYFLSIDGLPEFTPVQLPIQGGGPPPVLSIGATIFASV